MFNTVVYKLRQNAVKNHFIESVCIEILVLSGKGTQEQYVYKNQSSNKY